MMALTLYQNGFKQLVSVIPPNAKLSPLSHMVASSLGKSPGIKYANGTWGGYKWLTFEPTEDDVRVWEQAGANIGLLAAQYPAVDIDVTHAELAEHVLQAAVEVLGPAPCRIGLPPKRLLPYRLADGAEPFGRIGVKLVRGKEEHLVEVLGAGRQYLIHGTHPSGVRYDWGDLDLATLTPEQLTPITRADVMAFFDHLTENLPIIGWDVIYLGEQRNRPEVEQDELKAPSFDALQQAVEMIPNTDDKFPDRESYIKMGYAIKAASQEFEAEGMDLFIAWAGKHEADGRVTGNPETARGDWRKMTGPYSTGWPWIASTAREYGFNDAAFEFEVLPPDAHPSEENRAPQYSDKDLADEVYKEHGHRIRYIPSSKRWLVWDGTRWAMDAIAQAEDLIGRTLCRIAVRLLRNGGTVAEIKQAATRADVMASSWKRDAVLKQVKTDPRITATVEQFDTDPWLLNTPTCVVDLRTGEKLPHDSAALLTRQTFRGPDDKMPMPIFEAFLHDVTEGRPEVASYLQRIMGYTLTGLTREQVLFFVWGPGGNGKSVFLSTLAELLGDYATHAPLDTFTSSTGDKHPTDLADLKGARFVAASETQAGKRWDEARIKALTGGDLVKARFMRGDFFSYRPQFKLIFVGNHKPEIRDVDAAMRRRILLIPFTAVPKVVDPQLTERLRAEFPAILAWCIRGCAMWQKEGLATPTLVREATREYFIAEDAVSRWLEEACVEDPQATATTQELFASWREWANRAGEFVGSQKRLSQALINKTYARWMHPGTRRNGFAGIRLRPDVEMAE